MFNLDLKSFLPGLLLVLAFVGCSGAGEDSAGKLLAAEEYVDPKGFFSMIPPDGWKIQEYPDDPRGKVAFLKSKSTDLRVLTNGVDYSDISALEMDLRAGVERSGLQMNLKQSEFNGMPSFERDFAYQGTRILMIDFVFGNVAHNLMYSAPRDRFEKYLDQIHGSLATYQPLDQELSKDEILESYLAKCRRLGRLLLDQGRYDEAALYIDDGLAQHGGDPVLLQLRDEHGKSLDR